jgi:hypothetical protein
LVAPIPTPQGPPPGGPPPPEPGGPIALARALPPPVLQLLLRQLPPDAQQAFPTLPVETQNGLLLGAVERLGGPEVVARMVREQAGAPPPGTDGPPPGPVVGPIGPAPGQITPPHPAGGAPPPIDLAAKRQEKRRGAGPGLEEEEPPPDDWEPEALDDLLGKDYAWKAAPEYEEVCRLAADALDDPFWQERNQACYDQAWCYYRSRTWTKLNGQPVSAIQGDLLYMLSTPAKQIDRIVARCKPSPERLVFDLPARSEREAYEEAAANVENWVRDMWARHIAAHWDDASQSGPDADLPRKVAFLSALHGTVGYSLRANTRRRKGGKKRDINADRPITLAVIPWHELYPLGDITLRVQSVTLREARRMSAEVRERWPARTAAETKGAMRWYPPDDHRCRLIAGSDRHGRWYFQCFDVVPGEGRKPGEGPGEDDRFWTVKPQRMDYGFCLFQCPPGWQTTADTALPDDRQAAENYGRNFARGVLFANLEDFKIQDQVASAALSTFRYNRNPAVADVIDAELRNNLGEPPPPPFQGLEGERQTRFKGELPVAIPKHFADNAGDNFVMSMAFGQTADTFPAALGGGGEAQSGYDRRQMVENAQLLHVEEIREHGANTVEAIARRSAELMYRLGSGAKKVFGALPFVRARGGKGEGTLTVADIEKAGIGVTVAYHEDDLDRDLRLNNIVIPRVEKKLISLERGREMLGEPEPALEEQRIDEEMALTHPAVQELRAIAAMRIARPDLLPFLLVALDRNAQGQKLNQGMPGMPSPPGGGGPGPTPQPGVPAGNLPSAAQGLPPGVRQPPGVGV